MKLKDLLTESDKEMLGNVMMIGDFLRGKEHIDEFMFLYGDRTVLRKTVEVYELKGIQGIVDVLYNRGLNWRYFNKLSNSILTDSELKTVTNEIKSVDDTMSKNSNIENNNLNDEYIVPYDDDLDVKTNSKNSDTTNTESENIESKSDISVKRENLGFDKERLTFLMKLMNEFTEYRYIIYNDIANTISSQTYDLN